MWKPAPPSNRCFHTRLRHTRLRRTVAAPSHTAPSHTADVAAAPAGTAGTPAAEPGVQLAAGCLDPATRRGVDGGDERAAGGSGAGEPGGRVPAAAGRVRR